MQVAWEKEELENYYIKALTRCWKEREETERRGDDKITFDRLSEDKTDDIDSEGKERKEGNN